MSTIAIIPARGGSKRLPRKNILPLGGVPLLARVIKTCFDSGVFNDVLVSTEDDEIAEVALSAGASVHTRSESLARDRSTVVEVCLDILAQEVCEKFCCVYATAGLLTPNTLKSSFDYFSNSGCDTKVLMGVSEYNYSPVQALSVDENGFAKPLFPEFMKVQSQFHPKTRVSNGTFYWAWRNSFQKECSFYSNDLRAYDVPASEVCDLDTMTDYLRLQKMFEG